MSMSSPRKPHAALEFSGNYRKGVKIERRLGLLAVGEAFVNHVALGGMLAVQVLSGYDAPRLARGAVRFRYAFSSASWLRNPLHRRPLFKPVIRLLVHCFDVVSRNAWKHRFLCARVDEQIDGFGSTLAYARRAA